MDEETKEAYDDVLGAPDTESRSLHLDRLIDLVAKSKLLTPEELTILCQFDAAGCNASYHFADDSGREWNAGSFEESKATALFRKYPDLRPQMRELAKAYLWSLDLALKAKGV